MIRFFLVLGLSIYASAQTNKAAALSGPALFGVHSPEISVHDSAGPILFAFPSRDLNIAAMATDGAGNIYLTGDISASVLPTTPGVVQPAFVGGACFAGATGSVSVIPCPDAFVIKLD